ncbi:MAG: MFS transporter [Succinivibrio sp.]|nr:MFS transporter [Succinivibrio sp.]
MTDFLTRILNLKRNELSYAVQSFLMFLCIFCSYSVLRPVRDAMGIQGGVDNLQWLFTATFIVSFLVQIPYYYVIGRVSRRIILPVVFGFFAVNLMVFTYLMAKEINPMWTGRSFYVWLSVYNLLVISLGWSVLNDILKSSQSKRIFAIAAAGSSAGSMLGPIITASVVNLFGVTPLFFVSVVFLLLAAVISQLLFSLKNSVATSTEDSVVQIESSPKDKRIDGRIVEGFLSTFKSKYLSLIALFVILASTANTFLYFAQVRIIATSFSSREEQTFVFSIIDLIVNTGTIFIQLFVTGRIAERFGLKPLLSLVPLLIFACFTVLVFYPVLTVIVLAMVIRRVGEYSLVRPGKEMLFSMVSLDEKYKAKNFIDTVLYRGGDVLSAFISQGLGSLGGMILSSIGGALFAVIWLINALHLNSLYKQKNRESV